MYCLGRQVAYFISFHFLLMLFVLNKSYNQPVFLNSNLYKPGYAFGEVPAKRVILYLLEEFDSIEVMHTINNTWLLSVTGTKNVFDVKIL